MGKGDGIDFMGNPRLVDGLCNCISGGIDYYNGFERTQDLVTS